MFFLSSSPVSNGEIVSVLSEEANASPSLRGFFAAMSTMGQCKMLGGGNSSDLQFPTPRERNVIRSYEFQLVVVF